MRHEIEQRAIELLRSQLVWNQMFHESVVRIWCLTIAPAIDKINSHCMTVIGNRDSIQSK